MIASKENRGMKVHLHLVGEANGHLYFHASAASSKKLKAALRKDEMESMWVEA